MKSTSATIRLLRTAAFAVTCLTLACTQQVQPPKEKSAGEMDRTVLPIPEPKRQTYKELDARNAKAPARWEVKAPAGSPERGRRIDRRHRFWGVERVWRTDQHADVG